METVSVIKTLKVTQVIRVILPNLLLALSKLNILLLLLQRSKKCHCHNLRYNTLRRAIDYEKWNTSLHLPQCEEIRAFKIQIHVNYNYIDFTLSLWCWPCIFRIRNWMLGIIFRWSNAVLSLFNKNKHKSIWWLSY